MKPAAPAYKANDEIKLKRIFVYYTDNYEQIFKTNDIVSIDNYTKGNIYIVESIKKI